MKCENMTSMPVKLDFTLPNFGIETALKSGGYFEDSGGNCTTDLFNFNFSQAILILEQHLLSDHVFEGPVKAAIISGYVLLIIVGVITNLLVGMVIILNPRLRLARNLFIVNLSVSDLMLCLFCMPFTLVELLSRQWRLGSFLCRVVPFVQGITIFVSSATVSAIALDRQHIIVSYRFHKNRKDSSNMLLYTCTLWMFSLILSLPIIFSKTVTSVRVAEMILYEKCIEEWPSSHAKAMYTLLILTAQFVIPSIVLTVTHLRIKSHLNNTIRRHATPRSSKTSECLLKELQRNNHATVILAFILVVFAFSWLPWNAFNLVADFQLMSMKPESFYLTFAVCHLIAMTSSITNPILYGWLNSNIKREILKLRFRSNKPTNTVEETRPPSGNSTLVLRCETACLKNPQKNITNEIEECEL